MTQGNKTSVLAVIPALLLLLHILLTCCHKVGAIYYCMCIIISKDNRLSFPCSSFCSLQYPFQWNHHALFKLLKEVHNFYFIFVVGHGGCWQVFSIWKPVFLVDPYCRLLFYFWGDLPLEPFPSNLQFFLLFSFLPHVWQITYSLEYDTPPEPFPLPLWSLLKSTCFKSLLIYF